MGFKRLDIIRLSEDGEVRRTITCLGSRVSVFRSRSPLDLASYTSALRGEVSKERFSLLLDGVDFNPKEHRYIGFGEDYFQGAKIKVCDYLLSLGAPKNAIDALLLEYGLGGLGSAPSESLGVTQQTILQLIGMFFNRDQVIVLSDPFAGIAPQWREKLASRLADVVHEREMLIVIPQLKSRPDCWLENPFIARIPLEAPRNATIGFGGDSGIPTDFVATIRSQLKVEDSAAIPTKTAQTVGPETAPDEKEPKPKPKPRVGTLTNPSIPRKKEFELPPGVRNGMMGALIAVTGMLIWDKIESRSREHAPQQVVRIEQTPAPTEQAIPEEQVTQVASHSKARFEADVPAPLTVPEEKAAPDVLAGYPERIQLAVLRAFEEPLAISGATAANIDKPRPFLASERKSHDSNPNEFRIGAAPIRSSEVQSPEELEAQRAVMRQGFLQAMEQSRSLQNPDPDSGYAGVGGS